METTPAKTIIPISPVHNKSHAADTPIVTSTNQRRNISIDKSAHTRVRECSAISAAAPTAETPQPELELASLPLVLRETKQETKPFENISKQELKVEGYAAQPMAATKPSSSALVLVESPSKQRPIGKSPLTKMAVRGRKIMRNVFGKK